MRIAIIGTHGYPYVYGGFETFAKELSERLVKQGISVTIYCRRNNFKEFPLEILKLKSLQDLDLGNNSIQSIPEGITDSLPKLKRFILSYNEINHLPLDIENWFQNNISLQIRENKLSDFDRKRLREIFKNKVVE